jgi:hypothetical protein
MALQRLVEEATMVGWRDPAYWKWFLLVCVVLAFCAWMFRYEVKVTSYGTDTLHLSGVVVLDRWTGNVTMTTSSSTPAGRLRSHEQAQGPQEPAKGRLEKFDFVPEAEEVSPPSPKEK